MAEMAWYFKFDDWFLEQRFNVIFIVPRYYDGTGWYGMRLT